MSDMKCPFCQQELTVVFEYGSFANEKYLLCEKCDLRAERKLWQELDRTRKALDVAVDALNVISQITNQIDVCDVANDALNALE